MDLSLTDVTATDTAKRYVEARAGTLVSSLKTGRFVFSSAVGDKIVHITNPNQSPAPGTPPAAVGGPAAALYDVSGMTYYAGVKYSALRWIDITLSAGQDLQPMVFERKPDFSRFVKMEAVIHLL